ncbi:hypothetical protein F3Y22_tig00004045pilonHSYRG00025 [Hibiscus syriacus]|uniref:Uncharacterized protein n=1 Tax=Hibiscus syriacus TaxID=106335 RepID=A0A6A3CP38_HIBSY|nr:hypothetical protein F3Y22_tig00004045pilonHSYRG00025 [Hibiscus syriacus]
MKELRWLKLHYIRISESAKIRNREADAFSEKSEEDRLGRVSEKSQTSSEKGIVDFNGSKVAGDKWSVENANVIRRNKNEIVNSIGREQEVDSNFGYTGGWLGNWESRWSSFRVPRALVEGVRFSTSNQTLIWILIMVIWNNLQNQTDLDGSGRIHLEQDRAELLRKLDELKEQLSRSCDVVDKLKEKPSMPFYGPDKRAAEAGPSYFIYFPEPFACPVEQDMTRHGMYPTMHNLNHVPAYGDPFGSKMLGRALHQFPGKYQQHLIQTFLDIPAPIPPGSFGNKRFHDVPVHGHHIPEGVVKKAEKMAGTFLPGQYCGTTGVYVNGRELDQKDLDLLASSGLPTDRNRSYVVEISDWVLDEDTGEELESVGKLAPTAEKAKRRFGMKAPRAAA